MKFDSILVVCTGNICRSPIGERFLRNLFPNKKIDSAGTHALVDHLADISANKIANQHGLSLDGHRGKQFTSSMGRQYELILVMEKSHLEQIGKIGENECFSGTGWSNEIYPIRIVKVKRRLL